MYLSRRVCMAGGTLPLVTFGHGQATREQLTQLLGGAGVRAVVDVRTAPGSRRNPDVARSALQRWIPQAGLDYRWEKRLGGFRKTPPDSPDVFWKNESFRAYAAHARKLEFLAAMDELLEQVATQLTAVMCAESLWWRCHRRIIADFAVLVCAVPVVHLGHDGRCSEHPPSPGARVRDDGLLVYDRQPTP